MTAAMRTGQKIQMTARSVKMRRRLLKRTTETRRIPKLRRHTRRTKTLKLRRRRRQKARGRSLQMDTMRLRPYVENTFASWSLIFELWESQNYRLLFFNFKIDLTLKRTLMKFALNGQISCFFTYSIVMF